MRGLLPLLVVLAASGCAQPDSFADLQRFVAEARSLPAAPLEPLPEPVRYQPIIYSAASGRSPFGLAEADQYRPPSGPVTTAPLPLESDRPPDYLQTVALQSLTLVGTLSGLRGAGRLALVRDDRGEVHRVRLGDRLGLQRGRVSAIGPQGVAVRELVADAEGQWLERSRVLLPPGAN